MSEQESNRRISMSFLTPQPQRRRSRARHSFSIQEMDGEKDPQDVLFQSLMGDPVKRAALIKLLSQDKIENIKQGQKFRTVANASPLQKFQRKFLCESPTALHRRRALERNEGASPTKIVRSSITPASLPFEKLLQGVVAYVELRGKDGDRSTGAKALMVSMGATVRDQFTNDVTHVIFKDGSFNTYQKAKLMKKHLVSVLWLEAVRKNHSRVSEERYPALGTDLFDVNVSTFCQELQRDYEDIVRDELRVSLTAKPIRSKSTCAPQLNPINESPILTSRSSSDKSRSSEDLIAGSSDCDGRSVISRVGRKFPIKKRSQSLLGTPDSRRLQNSTPGLTSDSDSEVGVINGYSSTKLKDSFELVQMNTPVKQNGANRGVESINKRSIPRASTSTNESGDNVSSESTSLLTNNVTSKGKSDQQKTPRRRTLYNYVSVEETLGITEKSLKRKSLHSKTNINNKNVTNRRTTDMDFTCAVNDNFVTQRKRKNASKNNLCDDSTNLIDDMTLSLNQNTAGKGGVPIDSTLIIQISSDNSKDVTNKSSTAEEFSSLRLSKDNTEEGIRNKLSKGGIPSIVSSASIDDKSGASKTSNTDEMCSLRLSVDKSDDNCVLPKQNTSKTRNHNSFESTDSLQITDNEKVKLPFSKNETPSKKFKESDLVERTTPNMDKCDEQEKKLKKKNKVVNAADPNPSDLNDRAPRRGKTLRKLYNMNDEITVPLYENDRPVKKNEQLFKKPPDIRLTSFMSFPMFTPSARRYIENIKNNTSSTTVKELEIDTGINKSNKTAKTNKNNLPNKSIATIKKNLPNGVNETNKKNKTNVKVRKANYDSQKSSEDEKSDKVAKRYDVTNKKNEINKKNQTNVKERRKKLDTSLNKQNKEKENNLNKTNSRVAATPTRKSCRLTQKRNEPNENSSSDSRNASNDSIGIIPYKLRRSTLDFLPKQPAKTPSQRKTVKISSIVCTRFHKPEVQTFHQIIRKLGGFFVENEVTSKTSHLVVGETKRTINILRAIARGCWIVRAEWLHKSMEEGKWLPEEDYELTEFSAVVQRSRLQRQAFGPSYSLDTFCNCGPIYIAKSSTPGCSDLQELVTLCKGKVTNVQRNAGIVVGEIVRHDGVICVSENWLLDSIVINRKKSFKNYLIQIPNQPQSPNF